MVVEDVTAESDQESIIVEEHSRAHCSEKKNKMQIMGKYYFPCMPRKKRRIIKLCSICKRNKYERHPNTKELCETPIPTYPGNTIHIDIFSTDKKLILTSIDKFSKFM